MDSAFHDRTARPGRFAWRSRFLALSLALLVAGCAQPGKVGDGAPAAAQGAAARPTAPVPRAAPDAAAIDAEVARILAGSHGAMPPLQAVQRQPAGSGAAEIRTQNQTPYVLVILYSGPTSQRLTLKPQESAQLPLAPGPYAVAAKVEGAGNVRPFAGRQDIAAGTIYSSSWLIRTTPR